MHDNAAYKFVYYTYRIRAVLHRNENERYSISIIRERVKFVNKSNKFA